MRTVELIRKKRDGGEHSRQEIFWLIQAYTRGDVPDYQMSAWMMAAFLRGLSDAETAALTEAMLHSGRLLDLSALPGVKVDKHSTGGVGDKTSLIVVPIAAAAGLVVPMISGRGLGHTGGTLDKLEAIPGFRVNLTVKEFIQVLKKCGGSIVGQTDEFVPADKKMYALRDVTGTIDSPSLICASIMSKKLAEGIDALVLDVKTGSGAFMQRLEESEHLAKMMVQTGKRMGKRVAALITDMDQPLGRAVGNSLEVRECVEILRGERHPMSQDLIWLSLELSAWMLYLGRRARTLQAGRALANQMLSTGKAMAAFRQMCRLQHGDPTAVDDPSRLPCSRHQTKFLTPADGFIQRVQCDQVGLASLALGGGRAKQGDAIDHSAGFELHRKAGDAVKAGETLVTVHYNDPAKLPEALQLLTGAYIIGRRPATGRRVLVKKVIRAGARD
jgi:pyrimidine-nucleoside phosphorylase